MDKIKKLADALDSLRIFPRLFMGVYIWLLVEAGQWFIALEAPTMEQAGYMSVIVGAGIGWMSAYVNSGKSKQTKDDNE